MSKRKQSLFNLKSKQNCLLLKVTDERDGASYLIKFIYYPIEAIIGFDYRDVSID